VTDARTLVPLVPHPELALGERLDHLEHAFSGRIGWHAVHLERGVTISQRADERFGTASVIKVALVAALLELVRRGEASLDEVVRLPAREQRVTGGGILKHLEADRFSLRDLCELTIVVSDNAATNAVYERCGGADAVTALFYDLGLRASAMPGPVDFARITHDVDGAIGVSTPRETAELLVAIHRATILTPALCEQLVGMLRRQHYQDQVPRWLGFNPYAQWHGRTPELRVANKTGELDGIRNDCAIVRLRGRGTACLSIYTGEGIDLRETIDNEGNVTVARAAAVICRELLGLDTAEPAG
jgi:beta-lactamase class A